MVTLLLHHRRLLLSWVTTMTGNQADDVVYLGKEKSYLLVFPDANINKVVIQNSSSSRQDSKVILLLHQPMFLLLYMFWQ